MRILKFGGTSVANAKCFLLVTDIIENSSKKEQTVAVLSAPVGITNNLTSIIKKSVYGVNLNSYFLKIEKNINDLLKEISIIQKNFCPILCYNKFYQELFKIKKLIYGISILKYCPKNIYSAILCYGEKLSVMLIAEILRSRGHNITIINPVKTLLAYGNYLNSTINIVESAQRLSSIFIPCNDIVLMPGFIAGNQLGELTILGRNGSDYSAAILSTCFRVSICEIWTDVNGVYTCDPNQVNNARLIDKLSYQEAMELSHFGAKVLHPRTILPVAKFKIPCLIKNIYDHALPGTLISLNNNNFVVKGITYLNDIAMINIYGPGMKGVIGMASRVFSTMSRAKISIILIIQSSSEYSISFCISQLESFNAYKLLEQEFHLELNSKLLESITVISNVSIISVIGNGVYLQKELNSNLFSSLYRAKIDVLAIAQNSSSYSISIVVDRNNIKQSIKIIHQIIFDNYQFIEIFMIGIGNVGNVLINQIEQQYFFLKKKNVFFKLCGIINSKYMAINTSGIKWCNWKNFFNQKKELTNLNKVIKLTKKNNLLNPVIIDCTNSEIISSKYLEFLNSGFNIVTSNKKANSNSTVYYNMLRNNSISSKYKFLYETNIGAGLPIINNLQKLLFSGDNFVSFFGILSGSLSFIFGKLDENMSLLEATLLAREYGYTEPNPLDDLSGVDIARKLLILAREIGYNLEIKDIYIEPILPYHIKDRDNIDSIFFILSKINKKLMVIIKYARKKKKILRYVASIINYRCEITIKLLTFNSPLFNIKDGENAFIFFTKYYYPIPFIIRGYGAGNNVTASGIFIDILNLL